MEGMKMEAVLIAILITAVSTGFGTWVLKDIMAMNTPPKTVIQNINQSQDVRTTQNTYQNVLQGQTTITVLDTGKVVTNMTINIAGITNYSVDLKSHTNSNYTITN
jgi:uncharacterized membrane protein YeiH